MRNLFVFAFLLSLASCGTPDQPVEGCGFRSDTDNNCDGADDDCDGLIDEDRDCPSHESAPSNPNPSCRNDADCDDTIVCTIDICSTEGCINLDSNCHQPTPPVCTPSTNSDCDKDGVTPAEGDCNDLDATVSPNRSEDEAHGNLADKQDNDCDGTTDEWGPGPDTDGDKVPDVVDCDPKNSLRWNGASELCDDDVDSDCDGDDNNKCVVEAGAIDGIAPDADHIRIVIAGDVTDGLVSKPSGDITRVSIGSDANQWDAKNDVWYEFWHGEGNGVIYSLTIPAKPFTPRVRARDIVYFDLKKWRLYGSIRKVPSPTGRWGLVLIAP